MIMILTIDTLYNNICEMEAMAKIIILLGLLQAGCCSSLTHPMWAVSLSGSWRESLVVKPLGPCEPCLYTLKLDSSESQFTIYNENNPQFILTYNLEKQSQQGQVIFLTRSLKYTGSLTTNPSNTLSISLQVQPESGIGYNYIIESPWLALYIEHSHTLSLYLTPLKCLMYTLFACLLLPIQRAQLEKSMYETHKRICLFSLYMYTQVVAVVSALMAVIAVQYVYYSEGILAKVISYTMFGSCFLVSLVHLTYGIAIIQNKMNRFLIRNGLYKLGLMCLAIFIGILGYPLFLTTFSKGIWFFYFSSLGLIVQFAMSYYTKVLPYTKFIALYSGSVIFLAIQTDSYPVLNFHELSLFSMVLFVLFVAGVLAGGAWALRKIGNLENIAEMFEIGTRHGEQKRPSDSTEAETDADQSGKNFQHIKSDIELEVNPQTH